MATITEDYVSFEIAKLLKEKGFNGPCRSHYMVDTGLQRWTQNYGWNTSPLIVLCPTQQMAIKWLREVHNLFIQTEITPWPQKGFFVKIYLYKKQHNDFEEVSYVKYEKTYEQVCEAGIKYCLENLI